jgi:hypothetical protein
VGHVVNNWPFLLVGLFLMVGAGLNFNTLFQRRNRINPSAWLSWISAFICCGLGIYNFVVAAIIFAKR